MLAIVPNILFRVVLPLVLLIAWIVRPSLISAVYGIHLLIWPFIPGVNGGFVAATKRFLLSITITSSLAVLTQSIFHIVLAAMPPYGLVLGDDCESVASILRMVGLQRLNIPSALHIVRLICPDLAAWLASVVTLVVCVIYGRSAAATSSESLPAATTTVSVGGVSQQQHQQTDDDKPVSRIGVFAAGVSQLVALGLLCAVGAILPSIMSSVYFVAFLTLATFFAIQGGWTGRRGGNNAGCSGCVKMALLAYAAVHMLLLYLYQTHQFQEALEPESFTARLLGFTDIINSTCTRSWSVQFVRTQTWPVFVNPILLFLFYMYLAFQTVCTYRLLISESEETTSGGGRSTAAQGAITAATTESSTPKSPDLLATLQSSPSSAAAGRADNKKENKKGRWLLAAVVRHSYALALIMMMAWAITYHSWLSFVWLLLACVIWMVNNSRKACLVLSPFIVLYAVALLCLQFIYGLNLTQSELPDDPKGSLIPLRQLGLIKPSGAACIPLFIKVLYSIPFWIVLGLWLRERRSGGGSSSPEGRGGGATSYGTFESVASVGSGIGTGRIGSVLVKYWIYVVGLVLLLISIRTPVVAYEVCYMAFFVVLVTFLQVSFRLWRAMLFLYWMILTAFSIAVLLAVYTYQFTKVPVWWYNWTGWSQERLDDLGLVSYDSTSLFVHLLTPLSFLTVVILQMKFFHGPFMKLTNFSRRAPAIGDSVDAERSTGELTRRPGSPQSAEQQPAQKIGWLDTSVRYYQSACDFLWRLGELHFGKLVAFWIMMLAIREVSAVNFVLVVIVCLMLPCRRLHTLFAVLATVWAALIVLTKMIYQMRFVQIEDHALHVFNKNCSDMFNGTYQKDAPEWAGFSKLAKDHSVANYLQDYVIAFLLLTFHAIIRLRQKYRREVLGRPTPARGVLFPDVGRAEADESATRCFMFLVNYGFYKFGLEITLITAVINAGWRMDAIAFLYVLWVLLLVAPSRRTVGRIWWLFVLFVALALAAQYAVCVGLPPSSCLEYPWTWSLKESLVYWLYLPSYVHSPDPYYLIGDWFVLLMASAQLYVFRVEGSSTGGAADGYDNEGGDNGPIEVAADRSRKQQGSPEDGGGRIRNPTPNFITNTKSYLDAAKLFVFVYFHWITLLVVFAAGVGGISAFAFGYLVAAFTLLWKGNDLYLEPHRKVMTRWYMLLIYNIFVILLKITMNAVGCVFICELCGQSSSSWLIQLFSIACLRGPQPECSMALKCQARPEESEIVYDALCFAFLLFQIRIFGTWYFRHSIAEFRAERILSARGAFLMNMLIEREMKKQKVTEQIVLDNVKQAAERIRQKYVAQVDAQRRFDPNNYADAKRAGDYYMFNEEQDSPDEFVEAEPLAPEVTPGADVDRIGPTQLLHIAGERDMDIDQMTAEAKRLDREIQSMSSKPGGMLEPGEVNLQLPDQGEEPPQPEEREPGKLKKVCNYVVMFLASILNRLTYTFNRWSRDYRYVAWVMNGEKRRLKEQLIDQLADQDDDFQHVRETIFNDEVSKDVRRVNNLADVEASEKEADEVDVEHNPLARFFIATFYLLASHTELVCYLMIVLDQMGNAAVISLPLPLLAFFWGTLCSPRPPKFFWVTIITYTEAMIVIKFMFQFGFWHWDAAGNAADPFFTPKILGIEKRDYFAAYDVALLMVVFLHRYILKRLGLWKDVTKDSRTEQDAASTSADHQQNEQDLSADKQQRGDSREIVESGKEVKSGDEAAEGGKSAAGSGRMAYCSCFMEFYRHLLHPAVRYIMDLYSFMFLCDLICFLILVFGYSYFGVSRGQEDVVADLSSNRVPFPFVLMLITLMILIIVDRAIYLRKSVMAKLVFQYLLVTAMHGWIFFGLPAITDRAITKNTPAQLFYFCKCVYFILSAWQIRNAYPSRVQGNLLTKRFGMTNYALFTGFMAIPFLFELRTLIDWVWTETSMPLFDYFTMENMYACVFKTKCMRKFEKEYPVPRGQPKAILVKYGMGIPILALIIILIWLPLLLFALVNAIGQRVQLVHGQFSVVIEGYPPLYAMEAQRSSLNTISSSEYAKLRSLFNGTKSALEFLNDYGELDTYKAEFRGGASKYWTITDASKEALRRDLQNDNLGMHIDLQWEFTRREYGKRQRQPQTGSNSIKLTTETRDKILAAINSTSGNSTRSMAEIPNAFPPLVLMPSVSSARPAAALLYTKPADAGLKLSLKSERGGFQFWELSMVPPGWMGQFPLGEDGGLEMIVFVDRVFPEALDSVTNGGIIGLYVAVVLLAGRFIRGLVFNSPLDVQLSELPNVDRVVQLCQNLFLVREARDFFLEQDLFAKLVFLFRSPETLIRWTRPKVQ